MKTLDAAPSAPSSDDARGPAPIDVSDDDLLHGFLARGDAGAFRALVERYTPLVYAAARRQVRDPHLAEDVTQAVFILLARRAKSVAGGRTLPGWLVNAARLASKAASLLAAAAPAMRRDGLTVVVDVDPQSL